MSRLIVVTTLLLSLLAFPLTAQAEGGADGLARVSAELSQLNDTLEAIQELLSQQLETQSLELLFKRSEFVAGRAAALEADLRRLQGERRSLAQEKSQVESNFTYMTNQLEQGSVDGNPEDMEQFVKQMEEALERIEDRQREVELEISEAEGRLATRQRELEEWQDLLDRRLAAQ